MYTIKLLSLLCVCRRRGQYLHILSWLGGVKYDSLVPTGRRARLPKCRSVLRPPPTTTLAQPPSPYDLSPRKSPAFSCRRHCRRSHEPHGGRDARACARRLLANLIYRHRSGLLHGIYPCRSAAPPSYIAHSSNMQCPPP